jgi:hypothetical protein
MRTIPLLLCLAAVSTFPAAASADGDRITAIRALYAEANHPGDACAGNPCETTTRFSRNLPGTGPQTTEIRFFYVEHLDHEEQIYGTLHLRKAVVRYNIAAQTYYVEYLYEGLKARLAFHLQTDAFSERRTYFDGDHPIRIDVRPTAEGQGEHTVRDQGFTAAEQIHARALRGHADQMLRLFEALVQTADSEMGAWPHELEAP